MKWGTVRDSLRSPRTNERLWANHSGFSCQKINCEQIPQAAHDKRATVSNSIRSLMINEWMSKSLFFSANRSFALSLTKDKQFAQKSLTKIIFFCGFYYVFCQFKKKLINWLIPSFLMSDVNEALRLLTKNEWMSKSLICSFFRKKRAIRLISFLFLLIFLFFFFSYSFSFSPHLSFHFLLIFLLLTHLPVSFLSSFWLFFLSIHSHLLHLLCLFIFISLYLMFYLLLSLYLIQQMLPIGKLSIWLL